MTETHLSINMKRDLIIFGDSYGEEQLVNYPKGHVLHNDVHSLISYHQLLRDSNKFKSVKSYAVGGIKLWAQYQLFLKKYTGDELVVWFITDPLRFIINSPKLPEIRVSSFPSLELLIYNAEQRNESEEEIRLLRAAREYMLYMQDIDEESFKHLKILEEIKNHAKDNVIFIDNFNFYKQSKLPLFMVFRHENEKFIGSKEPNRYQEFCKVYIDIRRNHMIEENHRLFADQLINKIETGKEIDMTNYVSPNTKDFAKYFRIKK